MILEKKTKKIKINDMKQKKKKITIKKKINIKKNQNKKKSNE